MSNPKVDQSLDFALIDMEDNGDMGMNNGDGDSFTQQLGESESSSRTNQSGWLFGSSNIQDNIKIASSMSTMVQRGQQAWSIYGNIDVLRPYFNVEPNEVIKRLLMSLVPSRPAGRHKVAKELYGPLMVIFTLIALLLFQMKSSQHTVEEGTLMGTAFGVCFTYWIGASSLVWFLSFVCNTAITYVQTLSMMGYALFGHCIVLLISTLVHTTHDHVFFYVIWSIVGGLSALRMVTVLTSRTSGYTQKVIICCVVAALHLLYLLYLHFAYHQIVEEISEVFDNPSQQLVVLPDSLVVTKAVLTTLTNQSAVAPVAQVIDVITRVVTIATGGHLGNHNGTAI